MATVPLQSFVTGGDNFINQCSGQFVNNVVTGSTMLAFVQIGVDPTETITSVVDDLGNAFWKILETPFNNFGLLSIWMLNTPAGQVGHKPIITSHKSASGYGMMMLCQEVPNIALGTTVAAVIDGTPLYNQSAGATFTTVDVPYSSTATGQYCVSVYGDDGNSNSGIGIAGSWTKDASSRGSGDAVVGPSGGTAPNAIGVAYRDSLGGSESPNKWTISNIEDWNQAVFAFKKPAAPMPTPGSVNVVVGVGSPTVTANRAASISPSTISALTQVPSPSITAGSGSIGASIAPSSINVVVGIPTLVGDVSQTATPGSIAALTAVGTPTVDAMKIALINPVSIHAVVNVPAVTPSIGQGAILSPASINCRAAVPGPSITTAGNASVAPQTIAVKTTVGASLIQADSQVTVVDSINVVTRVPTPGVSAVSPPVNISPNTIGARVTVPFPDVNAIHSADIFPASINVVARVPIPVVTAESAPPPDSSVKPPVPPAPPGPMEPWANLVDVLKLYAPDLVIQNPDGSWSINPDADPDDVAGWEAALGDATFMMWALTGGRMHGEECWDETYSTANSCEVILAQGPIKEINQVSVVKNCGATNTPLDPSQFCFLNSRTISFCCGASYAPQYWRCGCADEAVRIQYRTASTLPPGTAAKVGWLADQLHRAATGSAGCQLPERVTSITRQGVSWTLVDPMDYFGNGLTGIGRIDSWITACRRIAPSASLIDPLSSNRLFSSQVACPDSTPPTPDPVHIQSMALSGGVGGVVSGVSDASGGAMTGLAVQGGSQPMLARSNAMVGVAMPMALTSSTSSGGAVGTLPSTLDLNIYQGDTFLLTIHVADSTGTPLDLTGYTARSQIRATPPAADPALAEFSASIAGSTITLLLSSTLTAGLAAAGGWWDVQINDGTGRVTTLLRGRVLVTEQITR